VTAHADPRLYRPLRLADGVHAAAQRAPAAIAIATAQRELSFAALDDLQAVGTFFTRHFPDVMPLMPGLAREFLEHPVGRMGTVRADTWSAGGMAVLLGDAAHDGGVAAAAPDIAFADGHALEAHLLPLAIA